MEENVSLPEGFQLDPTVLPDGFTIDEQPLYNYVPPEEGKDEVIHIQQTGEDIKAPPGTGAFFAQMQSDDTFDAPETTSTVLEESAATLEKQAAYIAFIANAYGMVGDNEASGFIADRSKALASALERQPEYMKEFNRQYNEAEGFFETAGVIFSNPSAIGRTTVTQTANSAIPLVTTL